MSLGQRRRPVKRQWGPYGGAPGGNDEGEGCPPTAWRDDGENENETEHEHENENENEKEHEQEQEHEHEESEGYARMMSLMVTALRCRPPSAL